MSKKINKLFAELVSTHNKNGIIEQNTTAQRWSLALGLAKSAY